MQFTKKSAKAIVAAAVPLLGSLIMAWATGAYDAEEIGTLIVGLITTIGVYVVPNKPNDV